MTSAPADIDVDVSFLEAASWAPRPMAARLRWLRENDPVRWSAKDRLWLVTKFADVAFVSRHQELFTSEHGVRPANPTKIGLIDEAEPRHSQLRALMNKGFTPRMAGPSRRVQRRGEPAAVRRAGLGSRQRRAA